MPFRNASLSLAFRPFAILLGTAALALAQPTTEIQKLTASDPMTLAGFGRAVSISGDLALVTAAANDDMGSAYVFEWDGSTWTEQQKLTASDAAIAEVEVWRRSGKLPFPRLSAAKVEQLEGTLDYPPRGSAATCSLGSIEATSTEPLPCIFSFMLLPPAP